MTPMVNVAEVSKQMPTSRRSARYPKPLAACLALAMVGCGLWGGPVRADSASAWAANDHARVRLISAIAATGEQKTLPLGLEFRLAPQWKTYWRAPGDAGYPPRIDWSGSSNVAEIAIAWPLPRRYSIFGLNTFVYQDAVVLPLTLRPITPGEPVALRAHVSYLLCDQICIPYEADLSLDLPSGEAADSAHAPLIAAFADRVPRAAIERAAGAGLTIDSAALTIRGASEGVLEVLARSDAPFNAPDLLVEGPNALLFEAPQVALSDGSRRALLRLPVRLVGTKAVWPREPALTVTLADGTRAIEQALKPDMRGGDVEARSERGLATVLLLAVLGGLILNLMPCVLPVLSLKLLRVTGQAGRAARAVRASFLATAAGVMASIVALGIAVVVLKSAGVAIGWGLQFQQPLFLAVMALVVTLFAANLWGVFSIGLPSAIGDFAARRPLASDDAPTLSGDFATGVLATLLATPCSAPFLGTAVGFALTRGAAEILAVFAAIGFGLALPYLVVAASPACVRLLPRPGGWMIGLRRLLGVVLLATAAWLVSVLAAQIGWRGALAVGLALAMVPAMLWLLRLGTTATVRGVATAGVALAVATALAVPLGLHRPTTDRDTATAGRAWQPFDRVRLFAAVAEGRTVIVDVTADWCITCQVNKQVVLERGDVAAAIERGAADGTVLALRADWTQADPAIAAYLAEFGRFGIPFNAVYGRGAPSGIALPELLRADDVLAALRNAGLTTAVPATASASPAAE